MLPLLPSCTPERVMCLLIRLMLLQTLFATPWRLIVQQRGFYHAASSCRATIVRYRVSLTTTSCFVQHLARSIASTDEQLAVARPPAKPCPSLESSCAPPSPQTCRLCLLSLQVEEALTSVLRGHLLMGLVHRAWAQGLADDCLELQALVRPVQQLTREGTAVARDYLDVACLLVSCSGRWHAGATGACTVLTHWRRPVAGGQECLGIYSQPFAPAGLLLGGSVTWPNTPTHHTSRHNTPRYASMAVMCALQADSPPGPSHQLMNVLAMSINEKQGLLWRQMLLAMHLLAMDPSLLHPGGAVAVLGGASSPGSSQQQQEQEQEEGRQQEQGQGPGSGGGPAWDASNPWPLECAQRTVERLAGTQYQIAERILLALHRMRACKRLYNPLMSSLLNVSGCLAMLPCSWAAVCACRGGKLGRQGRNSRAASWPGNVRAPALQHTSLCDMCSDLRRHAWPCRTTACSYSRTTRLQIVQQWKR